MRTATNHYRPTRDATTGELVYVPIAPLPAIDYDELDPGIRETVRVLREEGFETTDSGDGRTKTYDWALPFPHVVFVPSDGTNYGDELLRIRELVMARYVMPKDGKAPRWEVELTVCSRQGKATILLRGVEDRYLRENVTIATEWIRGAAFESMKRHGTTTVLSLASMRPATIGFTTADLVETADPVMVLRTSPVGRLDVIERGALDEALRGGVNEVWTVLAVFDGAGDDIRTAPESVALDGLIDTDEETPLGDIENLIHVIEASPELRRQCGDELVRVRGWLETWIGIGDRDMGTGTDEEDVA